MEINEFIRDATIVIVSSRTSHRTSVKKLLIDLGAINSHIDGLNDFVQAQERIGQKPANILITDDDIGTQGTVIELLKLYLESNQRSDSRLSILMPASETEQLREQFLKLGGDLVIEKPFTTDNFVNPILKKIQDKYTHTLDEKMARNVEDALKTNKRDKAIEYCKTIKNPNSPLATYSIGMISMFDNDFSLAYDFFQKSLQGKFDPKVFVKFLASGVKIKKYEELDGYVEDWIKKYPLSSDTAPDITRVVLYNKKFSLLDEMKLIDSDSKIPFAAGLVIASSVFLDSGDIQRSIDYAVRGVENADNRPSIILKAVEILLLAGSKESVQKIFKDLTMNSSTKADAALIKNVESLLSTK